MISLKTLKTLEFDKILDAAAQFAVSNFTRISILQTMPSNDFDTVLYRQGLAREAYDIYHKYNLRPLLSFDGIEDISGKAKVSAMLHISELRRIAQTINAAFTFKTAVNAVPDDIVLLKKIAGECAPFAERTLQALQKDIYTALPSDTEVDDNASPPLKEIRRKLSQATQKIKDKLASYSKQGTVSKFLQDNLVTVRDGRFCLPVKSEYRKEVPGLIHDRSATNATLFIEPIAIVEMNNELKALKLDEANEIERILKALSARVAEYQEEIRACQNMLVLCDMVFAKMHFSADLNAAAPVINNKNHISLVDSRHPLIERNKVVPVSISVGAEFRILAVTGPNTGGKTVALKTVGLFCCMAAAGFWIPAAAGSEVAVFDQIFADIGDEQSIANSLSTFSSHILNIANITNSATKNSLVLLDELGSGTDPVEGAALALGILKFLEEIGCAAVITTHYGQVKEYALISKNLKNACMQFDERALAPTYKLLMGLPGASNALKIAQRLGVRGEIMGYARAVLPEGQAEVEKLLLSAQSAKRQAMEQLSKLEHERYEAERIKKELAEQKDRLNKRLESINANARAETSRQVENRLSAADELIEELKEKLKTEDEKALFEAKRLRSKLEDIKYAAAREEDSVPAYAHAPVNPSKLKAGDKVFIKSLGVAGEVLQVFWDKKQAKVRAGAAAAMIKFDNLALPVSGEVKKKNIKGGLNTGKTAEDFTNELHLRGMTVSEAIEVIETELLAMISNGRTRLRLVHGKGTGALKSGIHSYLKTNKNVAKFGYAAYGDGDTGVTILELK